MAAALLEWLGAGAGARVSGLLVGVTDSPPIDPRLEQVVGEHPVPDRASFNAAARLEQLAASVRPTDCVYVLLSGGATSLIGAPVRGISESDYRAAFDLLLGSGLDIGDMNAIRKQISKWGAGRLALAVGTAAVQPLIISDVESDDPATIGSGPCTADPGGAKTAVKILRDRKLIEKLPASVRDFLLRAAEQKLSRDDFRQVSNPRVAGHDVPVDAAVAFAESRGFPVTKGPRLTGEASACGRDLALRLVATRRPSPSIHVSGGETTVTLAGGTGSGGRCQEIALSAARELAGADSPITLLVAGTDGRDGPTDAAGAIVDASTWSSIADTGRDPARDLASHDAYPALDAAGALLRTGHTGTNMMDLAIAVVGG